MIINPFKKIFNTFRYLSYYFIVFLIRLKPTTLNPQNLLLIRLDSIGDYILFRNFIEVVYRSEKYKNYKITLCGNVIWKDLAESFDKEYVSEFIWLDREKYFWNPVYVFKFLKKIYSSGFEVVINSTFSRENLYGDAIVNISNAPVKIGSEGLADSSSAWKRNMVTNKFYTKLIPFNSQIQFEFYNNLDFFEDVLQSKLSLPKPYMDCTKVAQTISTSKEYIVIFPGAQENIRRWSALNYKAVVKYLLSNYNYQLVIAGSKSDSIFAKEILIDLNPNDCLDITGKTSLSQLSKIISNSKLLVSNDTSAVHISASVGTQFICISNAQKYLRFVPYPETMNTNSIYIFPPAFNKLELSESEKANLLIHGSNLDINSIQVEVVINEVAKLI